MRSVEPGRPSFDFGLLGPEWRNAARLSDSQLGTLLELPLTRGMWDLRERADALGKWKMALSKGTLPRLEEVDWPREPFKTRFAEALKNLEMPRFTRRYPALLDTLIQQMLGLVQDFEEKLLAAEEEARKKQQQQQQPPPQQQQQQQGGSQTEQPPNQQQQQPSAAGGAGSEMQPQNKQQGQQGEDQQDAQQMELSEEELQRLMEEAMEAAKNGQLPPPQEGQEGQLKLQISLEDMQGKAPEQQHDPEQQEALQQQLEKIAEDIVKKFEVQMGEVVGNLETAEEAFDDLNALMSGEQGFDLTRGTWRRSGWRELESLRKILENVKELRELVRQLGRGGGKGPLRRAPEELEARGFPPGVIRSPLQPEEVRGLTRSGELSRMLPSEMALLAHGWPRKGRPATAAAAATAAGASAGAAAATAAAAARPASPSSSTSAASTTGHPQQAVVGPTGQSSQSHPALSLLDHEPHIPPTVSVDSDEYDLEEYYLPGAHAARRLHRVRRAERMLLSYERTGWLEDEPARVTGRMEIRPAAELGPIILCLDTSGSMRGARETVAKALALECMRGAHRQRRACYVYAFSGPREVQELELKVDAESLDKLLAFLACSFNGGTDVDAPLKLSLERLAKAEWSQADILMVTDGEIPDPDEKIVEAIQRAHEEMGLEVHGMLVSDRVSEAMRKLCTDLHVFKSWAAVPGGKDYMY